MNIHIKNIALIVLAAFLLPLEMVADRDVDKPNGSLSNAGGGGGNNSGSNSTADVIRGNCLVGTSRAELDINNVRTLILMRGDMFWDPSVGQPQYEVPKVDDPNVPKRHSIFAGAVWIGGRNPSSREVIVAAQTYGQGQISYWPGPVGVTFPSGAESEPTFTTTSDACNRWDDHFKINDDVIEQFRFGTYQSALSAVGGDTFAVSIPENDIPEEILNWPGRNNRHLIQQGVPYMDQPLARFADFNGNDEYEPTLGEYPFTPGSEFGAGADQSIFWVLNDVGNVKVLGTALAERFNIGIELQTEAFAYATSDEVNNMTFYRNKIINKGSTTMDSTWFGQWMDPDLGNPADDYVGCFIERGLGVCYNGDGDDDGLRGYGTDPPTVGVDFFIGPAADPNDGVDNDKDGWIDEGNDGIDNDCNGFIDDEDFTILADGRIRYNEREKIIMSNFVYYNNSSDPVNGNPTFAAEYYRYLRSIWRNNNPITYDGLLGITPIGQTSAGLDGEVVNYPTNFIFPCDQQYNKLGGFSCNPAVPKSDSLAEIFWVNDATEPMPPWNERTAGNPPGDRRFLQSAGPFFLEPGAVNELTVGIVWVDENLVNCGGEIVNADDKAQALFDNDFKILNGPNAPNLEIIEFDEELVLAIEETDFFIDNQPQTQSTYRELFVADGAPTFYTFQGYLIYQLREENVSVDQISNPDRARLVAQVDVRDGVTSIFNTITDPVTGLEVLSGSPPDGIVVESGDRGIQKTFRITDDLFAPGEGGLVNFRNYYYTVIAYGYNPNAKEDPYLQGRRNVRTYTAIPHKVDPESYGTRLSSNFGDLLDIGKISGKGNGDKFLELADGERDSIIAGPDYLDNVVNYQGNSAPIEVKIYNPKQVQDGTFRVEFNSLIDITGSVLGYQVGDTIISLVEFAAPETESEVVDFELYEQEQVQGIGVIEGIDSAFGKLEVRVLNEQLGGNFVLDVEQFNIDTSFVDETRSFAGYVSLAANALIKRGDVVIDTVEVTEYVLNGYYDVSLDGSGFIQRFVTIPGEEVFPEYGFSIEVASAFEPTEFIDQAGLNARNGFQGAEFEIVGDGSDFLDLIQTSELTASGYTDIVREGAPGDNSETPDPFENDPLGIYDRVLDGSWVPYAKSAENLATLSNGRLDYGPAKAVRDLGGNYYPINNFRELPSVDVVITSDKSKWTRVPVFQMGYPEGFDSTVVDFSDSTLWNTGGLRHLIKSRVPSVNQDFLPDGSTSPYVAADGSAVPSTGMSWFPGYAIDVERGIRLNMAFSESMLEPQPFNSGNPLPIENGNDLIWEPSNTANGHYNYIYIAKSKYDEGRELERRMDSLQNNYQSPPSPAFASQFRNVELLHWRGFRVEEASSYSGLSAGFNFWNPVFYNSATGELTGHTGIMEDFMWVGNLRSTVPDLYSNGEYVFENEAIAKLRVDHDFEAYDNLVSDTLPFAFEDDQPEFFFTISGESAQINAKDVQESALDLVRVVPNPYYGFSQYEGSRLDNRVYITNIPTKCNIKILSMNGSIVREFDVDRSSDPTNTFVEWNLRNADNLLIASGVYMILIDAPDIGEQKVIKWFGSIRPVDLESLR